MAGEPGANSRYDPERPTVAEDDASTATARRAIVAVLEREERPMSVQEVCAVTGDEPTTVYRLLTAMAATARVERRDQVDTDGLAQPTFEAVGTDGERPGRLATGPDAGT